MGVGGGEDEEDCSDVEAAELMNRYSVCSHSYSSAVYNFINSAHSPARVLSAMCEGLANISAHCPALLERCFAAEDVAEIQAAHQQQMKAYFMRLSKVTVTKGMLEQCNEGAAGGTTADATTAATTAATATATATPGTPAPDPAVSISSLSSSSGFSTTETKSADTKSGSAAMNKSSVITGPSVGSATERSTTRRYTSHTTKPSAELVEQRTETNDIEVFEGSL